MDVIVKAEVEIAGVEIVVLGQEQVAREER